MPQFIQFSTDMIENKFHPVNAPSRQAVVDADFIGILLAVANRDSKSLVEEWKKKATNFGEEEDINFNWCANTVYKYRQ